MDLLASAQGTHRTNQSVRWSCKPIILSIGQFEGQLKSNWTVGEKLLAFDQEPVKECRLILLKGQWKFFQCLISKFIHL